MLRGQSQAFSGAPLAFSKRPVGSLVAKASQAAAGTSGDNVKLQFSMHYKAEFGEHLKIVGNLPQLGAWNVANAPAMQWGNDHIWSTDVELPKGEEAQFKAVLLSHNATVWEPGSDRSVSAEALGEHSAVAAQLSWGFPELSLVGIDDPAEVKQEDVESGSVAEEEFDNLWNPVKAGLPEDITLELSTPEASQPVVTNESVQEASGIRQFDVTLEPEDAVLEVQDEAKEVAKIVEAAPEEVGAEEVKQQGAGAANGLKTAGQAAGYAVAGVAAAAALTALAVDVTDAAILSAIVAAGATFLPSTVDSDGKKRAKEGRGAASPVLGAVELGLKARSLLQGLSAKGIKPDNESDKDAGKEEIVEQPVVNSASYSNNAVSTGGLTSSKKIAAGSSDKEKADA